ncbi:hypothetical protein [Nocardia alni]|uniref:hypothetical protein n=1 Tax=Nocardia alni TaxID=2815723 RepID=UPI001C248CEE|nr:hypothetical protein [Nocardia alni]
MVAIGLAQLCETLPELRQAAAVKGRASELESLISAAAAGIDITDPITVLRRDLDAPDLDERVGLPGTAGGKPISELYECPRDPQCGRQARRSPGGPVPECHRDRATSRNMALV